MDKLVDYRKELDIINSELITVLVKRFNLTRQIGILKAEQNLAALDEARQEQQLQQVCKQGEQSGLSSELVRAIFTLITDEVVKQHIVAKQTKSNNE